MLSIENYKVNRPKFLDLLITTTIFYFITKLTLSALTPESNLPEFLCVLPQKIKIKPVETKTIKAPLK